MFVEYLTQRFRGMVWCGMV